MTNVFCLESAAVYGPAPAEAVRDDTTKASDITKIFSDMAIFYLHPKMPEAADCRLIFVDCRFALTASLLRSKTVGAKRIWRNLWASEP